MASGCSSATTLIMNRLKFGARKFSQCPNVIRESSSHTRGAVTPLGPLPLFTRPPPLARRASGRRSAACTGCAGEWGEVSGGTREALASGWEASAGGWPGGTTRGTHIAGGKARLIFLYSFLITERRAGTAVLNDGRVA
jgi:hypothetical protein